MAVEIRRACIHHKDGNPLNNVPGNWQVLCPKCHSKTRKHTNKRNGPGFSIYVLFKPRLRKKILKAAGYRCQICGALVGDKKHKRCDWCGQVTTNASRIKWKDGRTMCRECLDDWTEQGRPAEFSPTLRRKLRLQKVNVISRGNRVTFVPIHS